MGGKEFFIVTLVELLDVHCIILNTMLIKEVIGQKINHTIAKSIHA